MSEGELQKRLLEWFNATYIYYLEGGPPRNDSNILKKIVEEMKKDFPVYPPLLSEEEYSKDKWCQILDEWDSKVQKWFVKWLGE